MLLTDRSFGSFPRAHRATSRTAPYLRRPILLPESPTGSDFTPTTRSSAESLSRETRPPSTRRSETQAGETLSFSRLLSGGGLSWPGAGKPLYSNRCQRIEPIYFGFASGA